MSEAAILQILSTTGAAAALFWVLYLLITGKLHTDSEIDAKDDIADDLKETNRTLVAQLNQTNDIFERVVANGYAAAAASSRAEK